MQDAEHPFDLIRGRTLLGAMFIYMILSMIAVDLAWPDWPGKNSPPMAEAFVGLLIYGGLIIILYYIAEAAELKWKALFGKPLNIYQLFRHGLLAFPLIAVSAGSLYLLYLPLSYRFPGLVQELLIEDSSAIFWTEGERYLAANTIVFVVVVFLAPLVEELLFRGLLLTRWTIKWGAAKSIVLSSLIFGFLHADMIGAFFFSCVASILYFKTRSLLAPIAVHSARNWMIWLIAAWDASAGGNNYEPTLADFQTGWWLGALGIAVGVPWAILFVKRNLPSRSWTAPYSSQAT